MPDAASPRPALATAWLGDNGGMDVTDERSAQLWEAQEKARRLFEAIDHEGLLRAGATESTVNAEVYALAQRMYGITTYWHKRIVRAGANTLQPYREDPPDRTIAADDIVFFDLGPVFEAWEADFGRTYVLGDDPHKLKLRDDTAAAFHEGKRWFQLHPEATGAELFACVERLAAARGWEFGGEIAGHLLGQFPHERIPNDKVTLYVHPDNNARMHTAGADGLPRHWILEIHLVDRARQIGGFFEELLTVG